MRQERIIQASIFDVFAGHEIGRELKAISQWLDEHRWLLGLVSGDLRRYGVRETGRHGLSAEAVLRCGLLKQYRQLSYEELAFHLEDSASFRAFARLPLAWTPKKSVLHKTISAITAASWEAINRAVVSRARQAKLEDGAMVRIDSTVTQALMHAPTDSSLLWDAVRVMVRLLAQASALPGAPAITWRNHRRLAKKRAHAIQHSRGKDRKAKLYRDLIAAARATMAALRCATKRLAACATLEAEVWRGQVGHYLPLIERIVTQAERRVLADEAVPAGEKLVSLFEPHADIIVKGGRDVHYGHKINLATGCSGLILDVVVEAGNPADAERFLPMLERHIARHGTPPRQMASDGGYASLGNLRQAKILGVQDVAFHKKCGLTVEAMVKSRWVYRKLRNFRAGIEANISCLKRAFGLARCTWRNHRRLAKKRAHAIQHSRGKDRKAKLYRDLIAATRATMAALRCATKRLAACATLEAEVWRGQVGHYLPLIERIVTQAERRVLADEAVPAGEKLVSLFEPHADIIVKGGRDVHYGHKINLATGCSGLILDVVVEAGNPADAERFLPMLERHIARHGTPPRQMASDGGYASLGNLRQAKILGVQDVAFHKKCGLTIEAMVKSRWVYRKLRNFRAGIEANISCLKRAFGLARCTWRGLAHFKAYVWSSVVAYNLALLARLKPL